ncbi:pentatricopeptide repeat-containing protein At5g27110 [Ananas comosus]|uniref:Pentatricopeptide repeat-containing protein At5g27110 n=1 Tax=Ananas comosus TaxID=4615 RepID=A0A6P5FRF0_ANACO|nr:pentatricopeptide repeat-containing protein At5g27110 [Ananas comosus]
MRRFPAHFCKNLINFYLSFNQYDSARLVLESIPDPVDISVWNGLLAAYSKNRMYREALLLFRKLVLYPHLEPDDYTYPSVLKACWGLRGVREGEMVHARVLKSGFGSDVVISSSLVSMHAKCDRFGSAIKLFHEMPERDVASWNTVISCYYQSGQASKALELFEAMSSCGLNPNSVTLTTALSACARLGDLVTGRRIHDELIRIEFPIDSFISAALVDMYGKCGCLEKAREVFEQIRQKSVVTWNSMIGGYSLRGDSHACLELFVRMNKEGFCPTSTTISSLLMACSRNSDIRHGKFIHGYLLRHHVEVDIFIYSSLIDIYFKCGKARYAEEVFKIMPKENVVSWNVMISGYVTVGNYFKALDIFHAMRAHGVTPDYITYTSSLTACSQLAALEIGREIHKKINKIGLDSNEIVMCSLFDMYAKCGALREAREAFDKLPVKDIVSWTSMIMAYGSHGQAHDALQLFHELRQLSLKPDGVTFLAVISACSHVGLVDDGLYFFEQMMHEYGIKPGIEHYSCIIDLLGRSGRLNDAYSIFKSVPESKLDAGLIGTMLSACSLSKNMKLGQEMAKLLIQIDPNDHSNYVVLSNLYASVGRWDGVKKVRVIIRERGLKKNPGCSWVEVDRKIHQFFVDDDSHPQILLIYKCLRGIGMHMGKDRSHDRINNGMSFHD